MVDEFVGFSNIHNVVQVQDFAPPLVLNDVHSLELVLLFEELSACSESTCLGVRLQLMDGAPLLALENITSDNVVFLGPRVQFIASLGVVLARLQSTGFNIVLYLLRIFDQAGASTLELHDIVFFSFKISSKILK